MRKAQLLWAYHIFKYINFILILLIKVAIWSNCDLTLCTVILIIIYFYCCFGTLCSHKETKKRSFVCGYRFDNILRLRIFGNEEMEKKAPSLIEMFNLIPKFNLGLIILVTLMTTSTYPRWAECLRSSGSSSSSISIQSTSSNPPLAESFSEGACVIPQTSRKLDTKWVSLNPKDNEWYISNLVKV